MMCIHALHHSNSFFLCDVYIYVSSLLRMLNVCTQASDTKGSTRIHTHTRARVQPSLAWALGRLRAVEGALVAVRGSRADDQE
jgi:hypothetical protein